jgi:hypothetical protein
MFTPTDTGSLSVPIYTSPSRSGFAPKLSHPYDSALETGRLALAEAPGYPQSRAKLISFVWSESPAVVAAVSAAGEGAGACPTYCQRICLFCYFGLNPISSVCVHDK